MTEEMMPDEAPDEISAEEAASKRNATLRVILTLSALGGVTEASSDLGVPLGAVAALVVALATVIAISVWCYYDCIQRDVEPIRAISVLIVLLLIVGFPVHAFRTRGRAGFRLLGWALLVAFAMAWLLATGYYVTLAAVRVLRG